MGTRYDVRCTQWMVWWRASRIRAVGGTVTGRQLTASWLAPLSVTAAATLRALHRPVRREVRYICAVSLAKLRQHLRTTKKPAPHLGLLRGVE